MDTRWGKVESSLAAIVSLFQFIPFSPSCHWYLTLQHPAISCTDSRTGSMDVRLRCTCNSPQTGDLSFRGPRGNVGRPSYPRPPYDRCMGSMAYFNTRLGFHIYVSWSSNPASRKGFSSMFMASRRTGLSTEAISQRKKMKLLGQGMESHDH